MTAPGSEGDPLKPGSAQAVPSPVPAGPTGPATRAGRPRHGLIGPFSGRQLAAGFVVVLATAVALIVVTTPLGTADPGGPGDPRPTAYVIASPPAQGLRPGDLAPELAAQRADGTTYELTDLDGRPVRLEDLRGKAVWVNFWASWCPPCQAETPIIRELAERYRERGLEVVGISVQETTEEDVRAYARTYGLPYRVAADLEGLIFHRYKVYALPTQFFVGPDGVIRNVVQGPVDEASGTRLIESILPAGPASGPPSPGPTAAPS